MPESRVKAAADLGRVTGVQVCIGSDDSVWLHNLSGSNLDVPAGELFGFNTGSFVEVASGVIFSHMFTNSLCRFFRKDEITTSLSSRNRNLNRRGGLRRWPPTLDHQG